MTLSLAEMAPSRRRRGNTEAALQGQIVRALRKALVSHAAVYAIPGGNGAPTFTPGYVRGTPDLLIVGTHSPPVWLEVKTEKGRVSPEQDAFLAAARERGEHTAIVRSIDDALAAIARAGLSRLRAFA